ncbi:MAG: hypothetical protein C5B55_07835 [Blastocatellia bacterium]|nr:MAG: hypothetical protein C5B55_07835 [Blastocatellia bacterium]
MKLPAKTRIVALIAVLTTAWIGASAQAVNSGAQTIMLNATLSESVSLTLSANAVNFNLTAGSANNPGSTSITATTTWALRPNRGSLSVYAFFANSASALSDGAGNNIPSTDFQISDNGAAFQALTSTVPFGGAIAGLQLANVRILGNNKQGSRTDTMNFNINLGTLPSLPAGVYSGTLTIQVQVI